VLRSWTPIVALLAIGSLACDRDSAAVGDAGTETDSADAPFEIEDGRDVEATGDGADQAEAAEDVPDAAPACVEPAAECTTTACHSPPFSVSCIGGTVTDEAGVPLVGQIVSICVEDRCVSGRSREGGWFAITLPAASSDSLGMHFPGGDPPRLEPFCRFGALCDGAVRLCNDFRLYPAPTSGTPVPPPPPPDTPLPADLRIEADDGAALVLPAGAVALLPVGAPDFVALTRFPLDEHTPCFIDPARPPLALWVVTPLNSQVIEPGTMVEPVFRPAGLDLPNEFGLAAGAAVDVYMVGGGHLGTGLRSGDWARVAGATVTADGTRIQTLPGEGLGDLTWFGIYAAE
jgi:hypothetical protein